ncbi:murein L,D-transpeptidase [Neisseria sp.]|uniref:murein L,D-transpeptidase n=1 Tax=Neisseria sp. TaxID=192066 RepID=UPI0026DD6190|nr:murein L,D-transpeptidase [Neisseria sp.]MDO4907946.1 murein L,D-transpeptidase [Neisseria sp.]
MKKLAVIAMLLGLGFTAQAGSISDFKKRKAVVSLDKAEICLENNRCYPVLIGKTTPRGKFDLTIVKTNHRGYGGDVMKFKDEGDFMFAVHRVWTLKPEERRMQRIASPRVKDRVMTNGCINVTDDVYEKLKAYFVLEVV